MLVAYPATDVLDDRGAGVGGDVVEDAVAHHLLGGGVPEQGLVGGVHRDGQPVARKPDGRRRLVEEGPEPQITGLGGVGGHGDAVSRSPIRRGRSRAVRVNARSGPVRVCYATMLILALLSGCAPSSTRLGDDSGSVDTADSGDAGDSADSGGDTSETADTAPVDRDSDGSPAGEDCDDTDPRISPNAAETWNGIDDNCDGIVDGDGVYTGAIDLRATAIYEGNPYQFTVTGPGELHRTASHLDTTSVCTPDPLDDLAQLLLGPTLTLSATTESADEGAWAGTGVITSANGWDSNGDATMTWQGFDSVQISFTLHAASLTIAASGTFRRE